MTEPKWEVVDRIVDRMPWTDDSAIDAALRIYDEVVIPAVQTSDAKVADAWDEGYVAGFHDNQTKLRTPNPYGSSVRKWTEGYGRGSVTWERDHA